ncbi:MAG: hypothetical protein ABGY75_10575 [Gemmataceae bacterium]
MFRIATVAAVSTFLITSVVAAPVPKDDREAEEKKLEAAWLKLLEVNRLGDHDITLASLRLARSKRMLEFLDRKLHPVRITKDQAEKWLADLGSDDVKVWQTAYDHLFENDPRLVMNLGEFWGDLNTAGRLRMASIFCGVPVEQCPNDSPDHSDVVLLKRPASAGMAGRVEGSWTLIFQPKVPKPNLQLWEHSVFPDSGERNEHKLASWRRVEHACQLLEADGSKEAVAILRRLAEGHEKALPTAYAKQTLERLGK